MQNPNNNTNNNNPAAAAMPDQQQQQQQEWTAEWQERERRQRSVRMMMMFLFMLLLMDEEPTDGGGLRGSLARNSAPRMNKRPGSSSAHAPIDPVLDAARHHHAALLRRVTRQHPRYHALIVQKNQHRDIQSQVEEWTALHADLVKDDFDAHGVGGRGAPILHTPVLTTKTTTTTAAGTGSPNGNSAGEIIMAGADDPETDTKVWHYPWNATGFYRGNWKRLLETDVVTPAVEQFLDDDDINSTTSSLTVDEYEAPLLKSMRARNETVDLLILPRPVRLPYNTTNATTATTTTTTTTSSPSSSSTLTLTRTSGRVAFQLYSRRPLKEISLVDGFVKLYDNTSPGYSTRKDVLLRVHGVLLHSIGQLKLLANVPFDRMALVADDGKSLTPPSATSNATGSSSTTTTNSSTHRVTPFPFVPDDGTLRHAKTPSAKTLLSHEQSLETNAAGCAVTLDLNVSPVEWTVGAWRQWLDALERRATTTTTGSSKIKAHPVMHVTGILQAPQCNFTAHVNTTALRPDWDVTTSKSIHYSFYMMMVCLVQILLLLRQLLHSQSSITTRVSLLCIGWQTMIDALLCLAHIYLSLAVQLLFTAFASVAFFKLLIFCVIEMKYMAMILQARNSSNGGQPADVLRRQVAMLHLRFYVALLGSFMIMMYLDKYRLFYMLVLYSFWVPQIVLNVITEARQPLHKYYVYGMSITRLVAPCYVYCVHNNFLKEVYPDTPTDPGMMLKVSLWVFIQAAILIAQGQYGARFMIPARFLPPKFDYNRPLPPSMLPPGALDTTVYPELIEDREDPLKRPSREHTVASTATTSSRHTTARNRLKRSQPTTTGAMVKEDHRAPVSAPVLECSICYEAIDVRDRKKYMLAPCNHLFHKDCLAQWMDVKMECPICRTALPAL